LSLVAITACSKKDKNDGVVSKQFVHKYGFDMTENEWESREKDGQSISVLENGVAVKHSYEDGVLHGETSYTFPNSSLVEKVFVYEQGVLIKEITNDENGIPLQENAFESENRKRVTTWDKAGVPISIEDYIDNNLVNATYFKPNNESEATIQNGSGIRIKRSRNGEMQYKDIIENGILKNRTTFHPNGQIKSKTSYNSFMLEGEQTVYGEDGKLIMKTNWKDGNLDGSKSTFVNGNKISEIPYSNGMKNGIERHWDTNGRLLEEIHWINDKRHGSHRVYKENDTEIKWFYKGKAVSLKRFDEFSYREKLIADKENFASIIENMSDEEALRED
ncbi:MAG: hypothetical protein A2888_01005, partial [Chlamydiae bacterium RIFCSPLOWO2_01_FULL_28_7]